MVLCPCALLSENIRKYRKQNLSSIAILFLSIQLLFVAFAFSRSRLEQSLGALRQSGRYQLRRIGFVNCSYVVIVQLYRKEIKALTSFLNGFVTPETKIQ